MCAAVGHFFWLDTLQAHGFSGEMGQPGEGFYSRVGVYLHHTVVYTTNDGRPRFGVIPIYQLTYSVTWTLYIHPPSVTASILPRYPWWERLINLSLYWSTLVACSKRLIVDPILVQRATAAAQAPRGLRPCGRRVSWFSLGRSQPSYRLLFVRQPLAVGRPREAASLWPQK